MAFKTRDESAKPVPSKSTAAPAGKSVVVEKQRPIAANERLGSLDAYRGLTMLFLLSGGFAISRLHDHHPGLLHRFDGTSFGRVWTAGVTTLSHQLSHVEWTGCSAWDLIQPSFMFMVGVAMPFSYAHREARGDSWGRQFGHAVLRGLILVLLGIFLRSMGHAMTNFTFEDVLTQIGLGYALVFLLVNRPYWLQLTAVAAILGGYWFFFYHHPLPPNRDVVNEFHFAGSLPAHWNKHTNAAADFDRVFLNFFPRPQRFTVNGGGYTTLSFIPSMATMIFGLMAGQLLRGPRSSREKFWTLFFAGLACFVVSMGIDTTIWPFSFSKLDYSLGPIVKRIWTPSWAVFAAGWTFWFLALFYWIVDIRGYRRLVFPLAIVGMNSIAVYCMDEIIRGWLLANLKTHTATLAAVSHWPRVEPLFRPVRYVANKLKPEDVSIVKFLFETDNIYGPVWQRLAALLLIWLICLWLYRRRIFIRI